MLLLFSFSRVGGFITTQKQFFYSDLCETNYHIYHFRSRGLLGPYTSFIRKQEIFLRCHNFRRKDLNTHHGMGFAVYYLIGIGMYIDIFINGVWVLYN